MLYTFQNTISKWVTITSINKLIYTTCKNIAKYCSKYYILKASIKKQNIIIEDALQIWILNNLGLVFKIYLTIVNNQMQKNKKLEEDEVLFKAIEEEKTCFKAEHKTSANFTLTKSNAKF